MSTVMPEAERQRALDSYRLVDSLPESAYDDIVKLAAQLCDAPTALVTLLDRDRQWFKARVGFDPTETRRDEAFCDHAIRTPDQLMEIPDATRDQRFVDNPLVTGAPGVRFYAGVPLVTEAGAPMGTVCVLDRKPRTLGPEQRAALSALARLTMNLFEAKRRESELHRALLFANPEPVTDDVAAEVEPVAAPPLEVAAPPAGFTVAIVQIQHLDAAASQQGDRAIARHLAQLDALLADSVRAGDCVDRSTGSGEVIVLLRGDDTEPTLRHLRRQLAQFEAQSGLRALLASAHSESPGERAEMVFLRADVALSELKDAAAVA